MSRLVETGVLGFAVMLWFLTVVYRRARSKIGDWTSNVSSATTLACVLGVIGILVHSFVDFNLQIPANALFFYFGHWYTAGAQQKKQTLHG